MQQFSLISDNVHMNGILADIKEARDEIRKLERLEHFLADSIRIEEAALALRLDNVDQGLAALANLSNVHRSLTEPKLIRQCGFLLDEFRPVLSKKCVDALAAAANTCQWPRPIDAERWDDADVIAFVKAATNLVHFKQILGEDDRRSLMKLLMGPIGIRFAFHFETESAQLSADRPEWFFQYLERMAAEHALFLTDYLQAMIPSGESAFIDLFISELCGLAKGRLVKLKDGIAQNGLLLSHTISAVAKFYSDLRAHFGYEDDQSLLQLFLADDELVDFWLQSEKEALDRSFKELPVVPYEAFAHEVADLFDAATLTYENIEDPAIRARFFCTLQGGLFESFYSAVEFSLPVFRSPDELQLCVGAANAIDAFTEAVHGRWAQSLVFLEIAQSAEFRRLQGYDPSRLEGHLFNKTLTAFEALLGKIVTEQLADYVMRQFTHHASAYANAMHYGVAREPGAPINMHPGLHKATVALSEALGQIRAAGLLAHLHARLETVVAERLGTYFFGKVVLKNYFHLEGAAAFGRDMAWLHDQLRQLFSVDHARWLGRVEDALRLIMVPAQTYAGLMHAVRHKDHLRLKGLLHQLAIGSLTAEEATEVLRLCKR